MYKYDNYDQAIVDARVAEFRDQVNRRMAGEITEDQFKPLRLMNGLASAHESKGDQVKAAQFAKLVLERRRKTIGDDHPDTISTMRSLTRILTKLQRYDEAERLGNECLQQSQKAFGENAEETQAATEMLAALYDAWKKPEKATALRQPAKQ